MAETVQWTIVVQAANGPQLRSMASADVDAYDKLSVTVPAGGSVDVALGPGGDDVTCLVAIPDAAATGVTYKVGTDDIRLDAPLVLLGGAVALSGSPASLTFDNAGSTDASIDILIGRTATN